jgi:hypothetical protein
MKVPTSRLVFLVIACLLSWTASASAGLVKPGDPIAGHSGLTYFDLMRMVVTDLAPDGADDEAKALERAAPQFRENFRQLGKARQRE